MTTLLKLLLDWRAWLALIVVLVLAVTHWFAYSKGVSSRDVEVAQLKAAQAKQESDHATAALKAQQQVDKVHAVKVQAVAVADQHSTQELNDAKQHHQADHAAVRAGTIGVRLNGADCALPRGGALPVPAAAASMADAASGGLPQSVEQSVLDLRFAIERDAAQIDGLQGYIRAITSEPLTPPQTPASAPANP